jgi:hypothetical protein
MANRGEPLINVVRIDKPKVLKGYPIGLNQKVRGQDQRVARTLAQMFGHRRRGGA